MHDVVQEWTTELSRLAARARTSLGKARSMVPSSTIKSTGLRSGRHRVSDQTAEPLLPADALVAVGSESLGACPAADCGVSSS